MSIQSSVAYGHVGNSAATFPLMRMGCTVLPVLTVHFAASTAYGAPRGPLLTPEQVGDVVGGIDALGFLPGVDAVLSGFQGAPAMGQRILDSVALVKERNPNATYCCDPVMGDVGRGFFVMDGVPEFLRDHVVPMADVMTPNHFELNYLTGTESRTVAEIVEAAQALRSMGPNIVLVTSAEADDTPDDELHMIAVGEQSAWMVSTPKFHRVFTGSGDVTAAVFLAHLLRTHSLPQALSETASAIFGLLERTDALDQRELALVEAQDQFVTPTYRFDVTRLA